MSIRPLNDNILIRKIKAEHTTKSGIILPGSEKELPQIGEVAEIGEGAKNLVKGSRVVFPKYEGTELEYEGIDYIIIEESKILAVIE